MAVIGLSAVALGSAAGCDRRGGAATSPEPEPASDAVAAGDGEAGADPRGELESPVPRRPPTLELIAPASRPRRPPAPTFLGLADAELLGAISTRRPVGVRSTGGTSLSMYLNLEGDIDAAFKPRTRGGQRWAGEVAAYRLARLLEIPRVPPSISRRFRRPALQGLLQNEPALLARLEAETFVEQDNTIVGAASYWIPVIHVSEVERAEQLPRWTVWLRQGEAIPPEALALAQQLSETIVFDYVTGNWRVHRRCRGPVVARRAGNH